MSLLAQFLPIVQDWRGVFPQQRTFQRGVRQALGSLVCLGRRCLTRQRRREGALRKAWAGVDRNDGNGERHDQAADHQSVSSGKVRWP